MDNLDFLNRAFGDPNNIDTDWRFGIWGNEAPPEYAEYGSLAPEAQIIYVAFSKRASQRPTIS